MVLNMISTAVMIRLGKTYSNLMVDVQPTNAKLRQRARRIVTEATGLGLDEAGELLQACDGEVKTAIVAVLAGVSPDEARKRLTVSGGYVRRAISDLNV
jgi:N-acetylmuramic acid 6-phosphate etherase